MLFRFDILGISEMNEYSGEKLYYFLNRGWQFCQTPLLVVPEGGPESYNFRNVLLPVVKFVPLSIKTQ